ncbi:hypothetical protein ACFQ2B_27745 [Streptomyces stramineus]|uniref:Uncharacterized protein n=1 Tax=Streptomyces stramineus TaxID=173861 RepID=A0ABP3JHU9_9ACTN
MSANEGKGDRYDQRIHEGEPSMTQGDLPREIGKVLKAAAEFEVPRWKVEPRQTLAFVYEHDGEEIELTRFSGDLPVPAVGQTVTLHNTKDPLIVDRVCTDYGIAGDQQHASVSVYVRLPE